jgi:hypothetical protein
MPSPRNAGRGRGPIARQCDGEGEVCLPCTAASALDTHLTRSLRSRPLPPQAGGEVLKGLCPAQEGHR